MMNHCTRNSILALCGILLVATESLACFTPPAEQIVSTEALIKRTNNIVLAKVIGAKVSPDSIEVEYTFHTVRTIKGQAESTFQIIGRSLAQGWMRNFKHHSDEKFWNTSIGRHTYGADCQIYPRFAVGAKFLVFLDTPYHNKSFEYIVRTHGDNDTKDMWLQYVEKQVVISK